MQRLKSRAKQIPNGFRYRESAISWDSTKVLGLHPSFDTLVRAVQNARKANPSHAAKHKWSLDTAGVANDVEAYQVRICQTMGYTSYLTDPGGGGGPFPQAQSLLSPKQLGAAVGKIRKLWAGITSINDWLKQNGEAVSQELAEKRAATCVACPMNGKGDFSEWFTSPVAGAIKRQLEQLQERKLTTSQDATINICEACLCPNKLSVWVPIEIKLKNMTDDTKRELHPSCWVLSEEKELQPA